MAKRFTDTDKYKKHFMRGLHGPYKLLWDYLYLDCDHAGIWIVDFKIAQIYLGDDMPINELDALKYFNSDEIRIVEITPSRKWFIPSFVEFQYGKLNPKNKAHNSVINILEKYDLIENCKINFKGLTSSLKVAKDKDKELDKDKDLLIKYNETVPKEAIDFLKDGSIQPQVFFENNPCSHLDNDAIEIVQKLLTTKNPNTKLKPDKYQISSIKKHLLIYPDEKDILNKIIDGAVIGDKIKGDLFEVTNLTVDYITNPKNQSRLLGYLDVDSNKNNSIDDKKVFDDIFKGNS